MTLATQSWVINAPKNTRNTSGFVIAQHRWCNFHCKTGATTDRALFLAGFVEGQKWQGLDLGGAFAGMIVTSGALRQLNLSPIVVNWIQ